MHKGQKLLSAVALALLGGCIDQNPAEVVTDGQTFAPIANWSASMNPVGTGTVRGTLAVKQTLGYHMDVTFTVTGTPNAAYQWRFFRGDCSLNTAAGTVRDPGLWVFGTVQSYPDIVMSAAGTATVTRSLAGVLDSLTAYSIRIRPSQASTSFNGVNPLACGNITRTNG